MTDAALSPGSWAALVVAWAAAIASPGPDVFLLLRLAVRERRAAVLAALGIMTGNTLWITVSVLGISALLAAFPWLLPALQLAGSAVLVWMGVTSVRGGVRALRAPAETAGGPAPRRPYLLGFTTNIANPKALIFFTALLSQFLPPEAPIADRVIAIALMIGIGVAWFAAVAIACSSRTFRRWFRRAIPWFDIVAGVVFLVVAAAVLIELGIAGLR